MLIKRAYFLKFFICSIPCISTSCSTAHPFTFKSNAVHADEYSSNAIVLNLDDIPSRYQIEWTCINKEWFCRVVADHLLYQQRAILLKVKTDTEEHTYQLLARKGGDIFRLSQNETVHLLNQLSFGKTVQFTIGSSSKEVDCSHFQSLIQKALKNQKPLIEL